MSRKLGETLVDAGKITETQLHRSLTAQLVFGGHLGTSLLELGYIDEETLGETLSSMFGTPYADFEMLSLVPYSVIRSMPARLGEKHKAVPLKLEGKTLHLAMMDPKNLLALDEISFVTGYRLVPWVSPEVRILQALDKYYNIPRTQRFATLGRELSRLRTRREKLRPTQRQELVPGGGARGAAVPASLSVAVGGAGKVAASESTPAPATAEPFVDHWEKYGYGRSWRDVAEAFEEVGGDELMSEEADTRPQPATRAVLAARSLAAVYRRLATAESVDEIVEATLSYVAERLSRSIFFVARGGVATGWAGRGEGLSEPLIRSLALPHREESSILSLVGDDHAPYLGPLPAGLVNGGLYGHLRVSAPRTVLIVPITVKGRIAAYLYGDGGGREILALDLPSVLSLCARTGFALQIIILRNKILAG